MPRSDPAFAAEPTLPDVPWSGPPIAIFWDQSLLWALICLQTLDRLRIPYHLLSAEDVIEGLLHGYRVLLVPGGWASHKVRALGAEGRKAVLEFVLSGGSYLGFCGGAGLALSGAPSLGIVPLERMPLGSRLPNASGEIRIRGLPNHPAWKGLPEEIPVSIWWPSQFLWHPMPRTLCLANYIRTGKDFWVADLPVGDSLTEAGLWVERERAYGINLDPRRMIGQPAILEVRAGLGRLLLSYPHLETPGDAWGNVLFRNALVYLDREAARHWKGGAAVENPSSRFDALLGSDTLGCFRSMNETVTDLIRFGETHLLWRWRKPWLLQWRRGIRGLEYGTLAVAVRTLVEQAEKAVAPGRTSDSCSAWAHKVHQDVREFCLLAKQLLLEEKIAAQTGNVSKLGSVNETVDALRAHLFGSEMSYGGLCWSLFNELDVLLLHLLRLCPKGEN